MPWSTPALKDVRKLSRDYVAAYLPGADATVPNSVLRVLTDSNAGLAHEVLLYLDWLALQLLPNTAEHEWLDRHGDIWLGGRNPAEFSVGVVNVTGIDGTILPLASRFSGPNGTLFETTEQITVGAIETPVDVQALTAGAVGNLEVGTRLGFEVAVPGVDGTATVVALTGGVDEEDDTSLRDRVLFRIRKPPMGGDADDYIAWARHVPGVTRAWSAPLEMGMGTVTVRFMMDDLRADADPMVDGFPLPEDIDAVTAYMATVRPVAVKDFFVEAPIPFPIDFTISGLDLDNAAVRAAIKASVKAMLRDRCAPGTTVYRSWVDEAISAAVGEDHHELTFTTTPMPSNGHLAVIGTITYA